MVESAPECPLHVSELPRKLTSRLAGDPLAQAAVETLLKRAYRAGYLAGLDPESMDQRTLRRTTPRPRYSVSVLPAWLAVN